MWETNIDVLISSLMRLSAAALCGSIIGVERHIKGHSAGIRTHTVICIGSALTMMISQYLLFLSATVDSLVGSISSDVSRLGAQVISGVSFLGAGTIILTGSAQIKGLTTSAGLWAAACMGLAVGAGFYIGALIVCIYIILSISLLAKLESRLISNSGKINLLIALSSLSDLSRLTLSLKDIGVEIQNIDINKTTGDSSVSTEISLCINLMDKIKHYELVESLSSLEYVSAVEEI